MHGKTCLLFGEVLLDTFPDGSEIPGGAPFNVAWHLQAFGLAPHLISRVGDDASGRRIKSAMTGHGMSTALLQKDTDKPTGRVYIRMRQGGHDFDIRDDQAYDRITHPHPPIPSGILFLYHGSLALRHPGNRKTLEHLKETARCPVFVDVNLRFPWWDHTLVREVLADCTWGKVNEEELALLVPGESSIMIQAAEILRWGAIQFLIVTRGAEGALLFQQGSREPIAVRPDATSNNIVDLIGAGDAFAAVFLLGISLGWPLPRTMRRAQEFAQALLGHRGAVVADPAFYHLFLDRWK